MILYITLRWTSGPMLAGMSTAPDWHSRVAPLLAQGLSCAVIAERLGVARCSVERVRRGMQTPAQAWWRCGRRALGDDRPRRHRPRRYGAAGRLPALGGFALVLGRLRGQGRLWP